MPQVKLMGRHVMEALGKSRVVMEDGKVVEMGYQYYYDIG